MTKPHQSKKTLAFRLQPALALRLQAAAIEQDSNVSDLVRRILTDWLASLSEHQESFR